MTPHGVWILQRAAADSSSRDRPEAGAVRCTSLLPQAVLLEGCPALLNVLLSYLQRASDKLFPYHKKASQFCRISLDSPSVLDKCPFPSICFAACCFCQAQGYGADSKPSVLCKQNTRSKAELALPHPPAGPSCREFLYNPQ